MMKCIIWVLAISIAAAGSLYAEWEIETLDSIGCTGYWTSIRLDSEGNVHIVYRDDTDNQLVHIYQDASGWQSEILGNSDCWFISMVLDSDDMPHVAFFEHTENEICYVHWDGVDWITTPVESLVYTGSIYPRTDIELAADNNPHIVWFDTEHERLRYAVETGSGWTISTVDSVGKTGSHPSLCLDSSGKPHVSYWNFDSKSVKYAVLEASSWQVQTVDTHYIPGTTSTTTLILDSSDIPHISYNFSGDPGGAIKYAQWNGSGWSIETVISWQYGYPGSPQGICLDSDGFPHITVNSVDMGYTLGYAFKDATGWNYESIQEQGCDDAICLDDNGEPHVSYFHILNEDLMYAHRWDTGIESGSQQDMNCLSISTNFNPSTSCPSVSLSLPSSSPVVLNVFDTTGRIIDTPVRMFLSKGDHSIELGDYSPGVYFCRVTARGESESVGFVVLSR